MTDADATGAARESDPVGSSAAVQAADGASRRRFEIADASGRLPVWTQHPGMAADGSTAAESGAGGESTRQELEESSNGLVPPPSAAGAGGGGRPYAVAPSSSCNAAAGERQVHAAGPRSRLAAMLHRLARDIDDGAVVPSS